MNSLVAIVPVKPLAVAKSRLSARLSREQRRQLVLTMLSHVLDVVNAVPTIAQTLVVTADADIASAAARSGAGVVSEPAARGLNPGVERGVAAAVRAGATRVLVLPADLPFAAPHDIARLAAEIQTTGRSELTMVPAEDGEGTNALLISPPECLAPSFGPGSFLTHLSQALARRIDVRVLHLASLARDIDQPDDLARLLALPKYQFLNDVDLLHDPGVPVP